MTVHFWPESLRARVKARSLRLRLIRTKPKRRAHGSPANPMCAQPTFWAGRSAPYSAKTPNLMLLWATPPSSDINTFHLISKNGQKAFSKRWGAGSLDTPTLGCPSCSPLSPCCVKAGGWPWWCLPKSSTSLTPNRCDRISSQTPKNWWLSIRLNSGSPAHCKAPFCSWLKSGPPTMPRPGWASSQLAEESSPRPIRKTSSTPLRQSTKAMAAASGPTRS